MAKSSLMKFLVNRDIFGQPISVLYKGSDTYKTKLGAICTILTSVLVLVNTIMLTEGFINHTQQTESTQTVQFDQLTAGKFYLEENQVYFRLAIFGVAIPKETGSFRIVFSTTDNEKKYEETEV